MKNQEVEIKLQLTPSIYEQIIDRYGRRNKKRLQSNFFFDTSDQRLLKQKWVLRIRIEDEEGYITVKGPGEIKNAIHCKPEYESLLPKKKAFSLLNGFPVESLPYPPCLELIKRFGTMHVLPFLEFKNLRISFTWKEWKFELDKTTIMDHLYYELEVETDMIHMESLEKEVKYLFNLNAWEYRPSPLSKFQRALRIVK